MSFIVHTVPGSPFGRAVLATLIEKGASFRLQPVAPQDLGGAAHRARHPFGRVPALDHDGFQLYETQAIVRYLDRVLPDPVLTPRDARAAARMDQVMNVSDWYLFQGVGNVIAFQRVVGPKFLGLTPDEDAIAAAMPRAHLVFTELARLLENGPWFAGTQFSLAELLVVPQLDLLALTPEWDVLTANAPALRELLARASERGCFVETTTERVAKLAAATG
jgi:glutathione S-transferase